ncbi:hypothetical protein Tco_0742852 [Tanacetum coccineum]
MLKLTPFYNAFKISVDAPEIYMQEFWVTVSRHHSLLRFKLNGKSHTVNVDNFRDMLKICPKLPGQKFKEPPLEEDILSFIRDLGYIGEIKFLSDVNVNHVHQPWRSFVAIFNKCLSGKTTALENLMFQVENKNSNKNNDMYYPRFTKVIVDYFMAKDQAIPRRNKMFWHHARNDFMFTTVRVISKHQDTQVYGAILPQHLTNKAMLESAAYMTYRAYATGEKTLKLKTTKKKVDSEASPKKKTTKATKGKRIKSSAKGDKAAKKKKPAETSMDKGLTVLSDKSSEEDDEDEVNVSEKDDDNDNNDDDDDAGDQDDANQDDENQDDDNEQTNSDNEGDDFFHPKFSTHDDEARQEEFSTHDDKARQEEVNEEDSFDPRVQTPYHVESTDDESNEESNEEVQGTNTEEEKIVEEATHEEDEANELYKDVNVNLEGRDTVMTDAPLPNVQATQETEDTHVILTAPINPEGQQQSSSVSSGFVSNMLNPKPDSGIDLIFNTKATSLVDVSVTTIAKPPLVFATSLPPPPTPLITHMQQTPFPIPTIAPSTFLQDLLSFAVSSIPGIVDAYLANKMNDAVKKAEQGKEQVKAQVYKILPKIEKTVNEQLEAEVMTRSSTESKTSLAIAANLSELELKKILIEKMESNKSIHRSNEQKNLYKALVEAYESDKLILDTYGDTVSFKRRRDDEDKDEEPSAGSNRGSKRRRAGKEPESTSAPKEKTSKTTGKSTDGSKSQHKSAGESAHTEEPMHTDKDLEEPAHQEFDIGATEEQSDEETSQHPDWFQKPAKIPTPDRDWNKTLPAVHGPVQPWLSNLAREEGPRESFDELMDTPLDFSAFMMNRLKIDTLTPELLAGPTFELMKGTCKSLVELEYFFEEVYKATTDQLDWHNPEGQQYPHDLRKPLPLIPNSRGRQVIPFDHFINNDLAYLSGGVSSRTYATSVTKTKAADYGHIKWIEDLVPNIIWSEVPLTNLNVEDPLIFGVSLRMFTRSIVIQRRVEDLQLGVESYQKKLNITKPDTYISDLKRRDAYTAYSNPRGFIYQNKDKKNKLMRIDELHKFSDGTLDDVRTALNDRLKGIRMEYLPQTI